MDYVAEFGDIITPEELPEPYRTMAYALNVKSALKIAELYQGTGLYFNKLDKTLIRLRDMKIIKEFNGANYKEVAIKYRLTEMRIRQIVSDSRGEDQISIFDIPQETAE